MIEFVMNKKNRDKVKNLIPMISVSDLSPALNAFCLTIVDNKVTFVASDGYILGKLVINLENNVCKNAQYLLPLDAIKELCKLKANQVGYIRIVDTEVEISADKNVIKRFNLSNGCYPNYERVIPKNTPYSFDLSESDVSALLNHTKIISISQGCTQIDILDGDLRCVSNVANTFVATRVDVVEHNNPRKKHGINANILHKALSFFGGEPAISCNYGDNPQSAYVFKQHGNDDTVVICTPYLLEDVKSEIFSSVSNVLKKEFNDFL